MKKYKIQIIIVVVTLANLAFLGYGVKSYNSKTEASTAAPVKAVVQQKIKIKNAETEELSSNQVGTKIGEGDYKYQTLDKSKIKTGTNAELVIAANEKSGGHFVLAFLDPKSKPTAKQINAGWDFSTIAKDPMWAPGACSSKPTFLIQGKYIFIDDGKTDPNDKYNSYIIFDMHTGKYNYLGGSNFTTTQGEKEHVLKTVNENDKLVFYIDVPDDKVAKNSNGDFIHVQGSDRGYIIRREVDPQTMHYVDYSLPFKAPASPAKYVVTGSWDNIFQLDAAASVEQETFWYIGSLSKGSIVLKRHNIDEQYVDDSGKDTKLELKLASALKAQLPALYKQKPFDDSKFKSNFALTELGTYNNLQFITVTQRYDTYETPAIYDTTSGKITTLTNQKVLTQAGNYVELGVF